MTESFGNAKNLVDDISITVLSLSNHSSILLTRKIWMENNFQRFEIWDLKRESETKWVSEKLEADFFNYKIGENFFTTMTFPRNVRSDSSWFVLAPSTFSLAEGTNFSNAVENWVYRDLPYSDRMLDLPSVTWLTRPAKNFLFFI